MDKQWKWEKMICLVPDRTEDEKRELARELGISLEQVNEEREPIAEIHRNELYQVRIRRNSVMIHLSIKRLDKEPIHDWRDLQRIKNELVGPENEGVELFPAESRLHDTANQYHLWVFLDPTFRFGFGFSNGRRVTNKSFLGARQRPMEKPEVNEQRL